MPTSMISDSFAGHSQRFNAAEAELRRLPPEVHRGSEILYYDGCLPENEDWWLRIVGHMGRREIAVTVSGEGRRGHEVFRSVEPVRRAYDWHDGIAWADVAQAFRVARRLYRGLVRTGGRSDRRGG